MPLIEVDNVSKVYKARGGPRMLLAKGGLINLFHRRKEAVVALRGISFEVEHGEALGIIGANGSGKSTLLKLLAGVTVPSTGRVEVSGRVASLLELGAGFHPLLTGRENIYLNARILGVNRAQIERVFDQIVEFSGIEEFLDNPVNTYSSGMFVRLGFAVAVHTDPDIFLVDEVLSVGDEEFQRKCRTRIGELREQNKTIVFVSHDLSIVNTLCNRVILLSKGRMISRGSPRDTIDFYLRQIGRDIGIHTFSQGSVEAIFCHGRISVFHDKREVSAANGFRMRLQCMGQWQESFTADWVVEERGPDYCKARGRMSRLPISLIWDMRIEGGRLKWSTAIECEHETELAAVTNELYWPPSFIRWQYGEKSGNFPNILPDDLNWTSVVAPEPRCWETAILPQEDSLLSPVLISMQTDSPHIWLSWYNSDYVAGSRILLASIQIPETARTFRTGRHELMALSVDLGRTREEMALWMEKILERAKEKTITAGPFTARFDTGKLILSYKGEDLTTFLHFYASMLIGNLWNDSVKLQWHPHRLEGGTLLISGDSRRFPFTQHWEIRPADRAVAIRIMLEVREPMEVAEYHASVVLRPEYSHWETPHESGPYPEFDRGQEDWRHANRVYAVGKYAKASSASLPTVVLNVATDEVPFRMTAINTGYHENGRVLQALRTSEAGLLHFDKGTHLYFDGNISVEPGETRTDPVP